MVTVYSNFKINDNVINTYNNKKGKIIYILYGSIIIYQVLYEDNKADFVDGKDIELIENKLLSLV